MPVYRVPSSGEIFYQATPFAPRFTWASDADPGSAFVLRVKKKKREAGTAKKRIDEHHPSPTLAPHTIARKKDVQRRETTSRSGAPPRLRPTRIALSPSQPTNIASALFAAPLVRKSRTGGSLRSIAFYTTNDPQKTPAWKRYAQVLVKGGKGSVHGVSGQAEAAKILDALSDTDISQVFFVGHGFDDAKTGFPAFMFSGDVVHRDQADGSTSEGFVARGDKNLLLTAESEVFMRALVPHLSRDRLVTLYLLSCHSGANNRLQMELGKLIQRMAPEVDFAVLGYKEYYMVALDPHIAPRAHLRPTKDSRGKFEDSIAPEIPPGAIVYDDPLRSVALDMSDDPISGLPDLL